MSQPFALNLAINPLSFGSVSIAILRECYKRKLSPAVFPVGGGWDLSAQVPDPEFAKWLEGCIHSAQQRHSRQHTAIKLWHLNGSHESYSARDSRLISFMELDQLTSAELNIARGQNKLYLTSRFSQSVFAQYGVKAEYLPLGFDAHNFTPLARRPMIPNVLSFSMFGKLEKRKAHIQAIAAWVKRYGGKPSYRLNCALYNSFLGRNHDEVMANMANILNQALGGHVQIVNGQLQSNPTSPMWNVIFVPWSPDNATYNVTLQSSEIVIAMSGGEGRDLPAYHATALGAHPVALRAHAYLDYLDDTNAVLVNPNGKTPAADGIFFAQGGPFNVGNVFTWAEEDFLTACTEAERRAKLGLNTAGLELQKQTYAATLDKLLEGV